MVPIQGKGLQSGAASGSEKGPELTVRISKDRQEAFLSAKTTQPGQELTERAVTEYLAGQGVVFGLLDDAVHGFCTDQSHEILCARGSMPVDEKDGELQYLFRADVGKAPVKREDGTVDFHDLGIVQSVKKGDVLCVIVPPPPGKDGTDVTGRPVAFRKGRLPSFPSGHNTVVSEDGMELAAAADGCIEYRKDLLNINETFYVHGNVDGSSGNIVFTGTVIVQGDVMGGFAVKAGGDITVHGMVEGATLEAGGSITVTHGVNGMSGGSLTAGGNITARYFQNASLRCSGDVFADVLLNSSVQAGHSVILRGPKASLMGGKCCAGQQVCAKVIGTSNNVRTDVCVDSAELHSAMAGVSTRAGEIAGLKEKAAAAEQAQAKLKKQLEAVKQVVANGNRTARIALLVRTLMQRSRESESVVQDCQRRIEELQAAPVSSTIDFSVIGLRTIYAGTKIFIGNYVQYLSNDYSNTKFYLAENQIVSGPVLPSDEKDY